MVYRVYTERKNGYDLGAKSLYNDLRENLGINAINNVRIIFRYDVEGIDKELFKKAVHTVFSEPQTDLCFYNLAYGDDDSVFAVEYLPGQFDIRADSCEQCIQLISGGERPRVKTATVYMISGVITDEELNKIKEYLINPVEAHETGFSLPETLTPVYDEPADVAVLDEILTMKDGEASDFIKKYALAMDENDLIFFRDYFIGEGRAPTITELRVIDTYWSDHCRHTTFSTEIEKVSIDESQNELKDTFNLYKNIREELGRKDKPVTLMDLATIGARYLKKHGMLEKLDESEEINACTVKVKAEIDGKEEDYLLLFKNETHNHPTEIEPYGGASTCLGGAIRDPLSGRAYVYQAMRVTGAADPTVDISETIKGKLPQKKLTVTAANGYSAYGNQIGLATGGVYEIYHPGYLAKRMEIGAVVGAAPAENVVRQRPEASDVVILLGGKTGRDGCGGATGSSKSHDSSSILTCGAEVQKGNPAEERKLQRLMRNKEATLLIKRCNDFGAGGVSVAVGELSDGLDINLSAVPKKYDGLDGTELAISESQERMAVVVAKENTEKFISLASKENLDATVIASVTDTGRMRMFWRDKLIVDISRVFLSSNGAKKYTDADVSGFDSKAFNDSLKADCGSAESVSDKIRHLLASLNVCSEKGLAERFDSTIGASTVIFPFGGKYQLTKQQYMAALLPAESKNVNTASVMSYGFDPYISEVSEYHGAYLAVLSSLSKLVASGAGLDDSYFTFQEYFEKMKDEKAFGKPLSSLLGALQAQLDYGIAAIGGKDSMSGTYEDIHVPPTLVSFAITTEKPENLISSEFKSPGNNIYLAVTDLDRFIPSPEKQKELFNDITKEIRNKNIISAYSVEYGGIAEALSVMSFGNKVGVKIENDNINLFRKYYGALIVESKEKLEGECFIYLGKTTEEKVISVLGESIAIDSLITSYQDTLSGVFPEKTQIGKDKAVDCENHETNLIPAYSSNIKVAKPKVVIPVFPGTNCEYDTEKAFKEAGADTDLVIIRNKDPQSLKESIEEFATKLKNAQILMIPGGFSGADEPDGSGKFITAVLRNEIISESVNKLLTDNDGLILGICNGFQALVKSGLLPYGEIKSEMTCNDATLTFNPIARHRSMYVNTVISSVHSPWLSGMKTGEVYAVPVSHGEGRFTAPKELIERLEKENRIATRYVDLDTNPTLDSDFNPNFSDNAIEGILSPDGRIFGKMGHSERYGDNICINIPGNKKQDIFSCGVRYFTD